MLAYSVFALIVIIAFVLGSLWGKGITIKQFQGYPEDSENYNDTSEFMDEDVKNYIDLHEKRGERT